MGALLALLAAGMTSATGVIPTSEWIDIYSSASTVGGFEPQPLPVDSVVGVFDPDGVQCGEFVATSPGRFGIMPCYRDDFATSVDEGAEPGDELAFTINGAPATPQPVSLNG